MSKPDGISSAALFWHGQPAHQCVWSVRVGDSVEDPGRQNGVNSPGLVGDLGDPHVNAGARVRERRSFVDTEQYLQPAHHRVQGIAHRCVEIGIEAT